MRTRTAWVAAVALVASAGLGGCRKSTPQVPAPPLQPGAAATLGEAPSPGRLPAAATAARIGPPADYHDAYAYTDRAWGMSWAFGDSAPDYAFYADGVTPWVWVSDDDSECLAEPAPGGERYYYFAPGAYTPFYVQDPSYGYGYDNGQLVAIYDRGGREVAPAADPTAAAAASQYLARGRLLRQEASSQPHQAVAAASWNARRKLIAAEHTTFARDAARNPEWRAYHDLHRAQDQARFAAEATRRESGAAQADMRFGERSRAEREQRLALSLAGNGAPGSMPRQAAAPRSRLAAAAPRSAAVAATRRSAERGGLFERQVREVRPARAARGPVMARRAATEYARPATLRARASTAHVAWAPRAQAHAFRAPRVRAAMAMRAAPARAAPRHAAGRRR